MGGPIKFSAIIPIALILISLSLAGAGFYLYQKEHAANAALTAELSDLKEREKILKAKLDESGKTINSLETKVQDALTQLSALNTRLEEEKSASAAKDAELAQLNAEAQKQKDAAAALSKKFQEAQESAKIIQSQLKDLESQKAQLEAKIKDMEVKAKQAAQSAQPAKAEGVELGKIVVNPEAAIEKEKAKAPAAALEGKVLVVNKDYNFAVINVGNKDEAEVGDIFSVYSGSKNIGMIKVDRVHDSMSAASFISSEIKDKIKEGDKVVRKTK